MFKVGIITASDKGYIGERKDESGEVIAEIMREERYTIERKTIVPDDIDMLYQEMVTMANGISEAIRYYSLQITPRAMLSRAVSGIRGNTLIINLPGSPKAVKESLGFILDSLHHGLEILTGRGSECARK